MQLADYKEPFFTVTIQPHRFVGFVFAAHIAKLTSKDGGIFTVQDNILQANTKLWAGSIPPEGRDIIKQIEETSDTHLLKTIGKGHYQAASFFGAAAKKPALGEYLQDYVERRIAKCYDLLAASSIPVFFKEKNFNNLYLENKLTLYQQEAEPVFRFGLSYPEAWYSLSATLNDEPIRLKQRKGEIISNNPAIVLLGSDLVRFNGIDGKKLKPFFTLPRVTIPSTARQKYFETFVKNAIRNQRVEAEGFIIEDVKPKAQAILMLEERLCGSLGLVLYYKYGIKNYLSNSKPQREVTMSEDILSYHFTRFERNVEWEEEVRLKCAELGLQNIQGAEYIPRDIESYKYDADFVMIQWLSEHSDKLSQAGFVVEQKTGRTHYYLNKHEVKLTASPNNDWFDVHGHVQVEGYKLPFMAFRKNILHGIREFVLPNGQIFILPKEWFARFKPIFNATRGDEETIRVGRYHFPTLEAMGIDCPDVAELRRRFMQVESTKKVEIPTELKAELRSYQKQGLFWLQLLYENKLGGCLADDMGLGKTIQTIAVLLHHFGNGKAKTDMPKQEGVINLSKTALIVVPTSLLFNWKREIAQFAPKLKVHIHAGPSREKSVNLLKKHSVVLTSYGVMRNDIEFLMSIRFAYLVLDESQMLKNPMSKGYRAAMLLKANHTLTLSGTPIENSLSDLWAQLNIVNRGMLGTLKSFTNTYINPIERDGDERQAEELKKLIQPFILRRTKEEAAKDLPPLTEHVVYCDLTDEQKRMYEEEKSEIRNLILDSISELGYKNSAISILRGLTRLRQLANHPSMLFPDTEIDSGKFERITTDIENIVAEGHKILVFSSFVKHLRLVEQHLIGSGIGYTMLIGASRNRDQLVDAFQNDPKTSVFLISIKAGGVGLNLTAADYIFVLDPWWNPAVENQAVARAHRIGQDKSVFVYRFISVDTVEEKILKLQEKKKLLASEFVGNNNPLSLISEEQLMGMLE